MLSPASSAAEIVEHLRALASEENREGMKRYGIRVDRALGIPHGDQRRIAKTIRRNHQRAFELWASCITEARFIAGLTADPKRFTKANAHDWASDFDSWDIVDGVSDLFVNTDHWQELIAEFADDEGEFVRRTAFAMSAWAVVHRKQEPDETFLGLLSLVERHAGDDRNFVRKAVSWALRSIGKRNRALNAAARETAERLAERPERPARTTGREALRELTSEKTLAGVDRREAAAAAGPATAS